MKSIQNKLSLFISLVVVIAVLTITAASLLLLSRSMNAQLTEEVSALADAYSQAVYNHIEGFRQELRVVAAMPDASKLSGSAQEEFFARLSEQSSFRYFALSDDKGQTSRSSDISSRDYFQQAMQGKVALSSPLVNLVDGSVTIIMAAPVNNGTGYKGVVYGGISYDVFGSLIDDIQVGEGGYAFVVDRVGVTVGHPDPKTVENMVNYIELAKSEPEYALAGQAVARMITGESGTAHTEYNGQRRLVGFTPIPGPEQWSIAVTVPVSQVQANLTSALWISAIIGAVILVAGSMFALLLSRSISRPIISVTRRIEQLAQGDLTTDVPKVSGRDEIARLSGALNHTVTTLREYISDITAVLSSMASNDFTVGSRTLYAGDFMPIRDALGSILDALNETFQNITGVAEQVHVGASQMAAGAQGLAQSSTEQASTIEDLTHAVHNISQQVHDNAQNAASVADLSRQAGAEVGRGDEQMQRLQQSMQEIRQTSREIASIIKIIDDIAFQTNILALNAAVEAARAGNAGKGFAVVADEVRSLAARSAEAARTTTQLIESSVRSVEDGNAIANDTAASLQSIVEKVRTVNTLIDSIAQASQEQSESIVHITGGMGQISEVIQINSATAQETAASSEELNSQSELLRDWIGRFQLQGMESAALPQAADAPRLSSGAKERPGMLGKY